MQKDSIFIEKKPPPEYSISTNDTTVCEGAPISLTATGGSKFEWYINRQLWQTGVNTVMSAFEKESIVSVKVTNISCLDSLELFSKISIFEPIKSVVEKSGDLSCDITSVKLNASGGHDYFWFPNDGLDNNRISSPVLTLQKKQKLFVRISDVNGCSKVDSIFINFDNYQNFIVTPDTAICPDNIIQLEARGAQKLNWWPSQLLDDPTSPTPKANFLNSITYYVYGRTANGCEAMDSVVLSKKNVISWEIVPDKLLVCGSDTVQIKGPSEGQHYFWGSKAIIGPSNQDIVKVLIGNGPEFIYFKWRDKFGCFGEDSLMINWRPAPFYKMTPDDTTICKGGFAEIRAYGGNRYQWQSLNQEFINGDSVSLLVNPETDSIFRVKIWNDVCLDSTFLSSLIFVNKLPQFSVSSSNIITCSNPNSLLLASGNGRFKWSPETGLNNPNIPNPIASPATTTTYSVSLTDSVSGCKILQVVNIVCYYEFCIENSNGSGLCWGATHQG